MSNTRYEMQDGNLVKVYLPEQLSETRFFRKYVTNPRRPIISSVTMIDDEYDYDSSDVESDDGAPPEIATGIIFDLSDDSEAGLTLEGEALDYLTRARPLDDTTKFLDGSKPSANGYRLTSFVVKKYLDPESTIKQVVTEITQTYSKFGPVAAPENIIRHEDSKEIATSSLIAELELLGDRNQTKLALMLKLANNDFLANVDLSEVFKMLTNEVQADFCMHIATQENGKSGKAWADELCDVIAQLSDNNKNVVFEKLSSAWDVRSQQELYQRFVGPELVGSTHGNTVNFRPEILKAYYDITQIIKSLEAKLSTSNSRSHWRSYVSFIAPPVTIAAKIAAANCLLMILINGNSLGQVEQNKQHTAAFKTSTIKAVEARLFEAGFLVITDTALAARAQAVGPSASAK